MQNKEITLELLRLYQTYAEQLNISSNLSSILHRVKDIKASGNEIEIAFRNVLNELLPKKYKVSNGHIVDSQLNVSKQYDLIISENIEYSPIATFKDSTELFFYETIYCIGEVKATWNPKNFLETLGSIRDLKERLARKSISNKTLISGSQEITLETPLSKNPTRNPVFSFAFSIKEDSNFHKLKESYRLDTTLSYHPGVTVILNRGIFVLVDKEALSEGNVVLNLYPQFITDYSSVIWKFIDCKNGGKNLAYLLFCIYEHLSSVILEKPPYLKYSTSILDLDAENLLDLNEL